MKISIHSDFVICSSNPFVLLTLVNVLPAINSMPYLLKIHGACCCCCCCCYVRVLTHFIASEIQHVVGLAKIWKA
jgi:streptolysin S family bacteriocin protoxin